jgi:hypothetical protein
MPTIQFHSKREDQNYNVYKDDSNGTASTFRAFLMVCYSGSEPRRKKDFLRFEMRVASASKKLIRDDPVVVQERRPKSRFAAVALLVFGIYVSTVYDVSNPSAHASTSKTAVENNIPQAQARGEIKTASSKVIKDMRRGVRRGDVTEQSSDVGDEVGEQTLPSSRAWRSFVGGPSKHDMIDREAEQSSTELVIRRDQWTEPKLESRMNQQQRLVRTGYVGMRGSSEETSRGSSFGEPRSLYFEWRCGEVGFMRG